MAFVVFSCMSFFFFLIWELRVVVVSRLGEDFPVFLKQCSFVKWLAKFQLFNFQGSLVVWLIALCIFFLGAKPFIAIPLFLGKTGTQKKATHVFFSLTILQTSFPPNKTSLYQWLTLRFCLDSNSHVKKWGFYCGDTDNFLTVWGSWKLEQWSFHPTCSG